MLNSYSQERQSILNKAIQSYQKELPDMQETIFKKFCKLYKQGNIHKNDIGKYQIVVVPSFKLNKNFIQYKDGDMFASYIDFKSMWRSYDGYIFKDSSYVGLLYFDKGLSFFSTTIDNDLAKQIRNFKPDMVFYPDSKMLLCCIKDGKFYIAEIINASSIVFLPEDEFNKTYPSRLKELSKFGFPALKHYKQLK
jgi:hypothetical protein